MTNPKVRLTVHDVLAVDVFYYFNIMPDKGSRPNIYEWYYTMSVEDAEALAAMWKELTIVPFPRFSFV